jgi:hypothetical protein
MWAVFLAANINTCQRNQAFYAGFNPLRSGLEPTLGFFKEKTKWDVLSKLKKSSKVPATVKTLDSMHCCH